MNKQAPHVVALKAAFFDAYEMKLNVRKAGGSLRECLILTVPDLRGREEVDRAQLVELGGWLEERGYYLCHDFHRQGLLSSPAGWTCWNGGATVLVRYWPDKENTN